MRLLPDNFVIEGEDFYLRPITVADTDRVLEWRNSEYVVSEFFYRYPITEEQHLNWLNNKVFVGEVYQFIVVMKEGGTPVGSVYLQHYLPENNSIEAGIFMSETAPKGIHLGSRAYKAMIYGAARDVLGFDKVYTRVLADNIPSNKLHLNVGFTETGRELNRIVPDDIEAETVIYELQLNTAK